MNKIFKVIWSKSKQCYIVVSEIAKNKTGKKKIVVAGIFAALAMVNGGQATFAAWPAGGEGAQSAFWMGRSSSATGQNAQAIGVAANASSAKSVAIGSDSFAQGVPSGGEANAATAVGAHSNATGPGASAFGFKAIANAGNATAIGTDANVSGQYSVGVGWKSKVTVDNSIAIGEQAKALKEGSSVMGPDARGYGNGSLSLGYQALAGANTYTGAVNNGAPFDDKAATINAYNKWGDAAIGLRAVATGGNATALGRSASATAANAIAIGGGNGDSAIDNTEKTEATGEKSTAIGYNAKAKNTNDIAIGMTANASDGNAIAIGRNVTSAGGASTSIGYYSSVTGNQSIGIGSQISNSAQKATAIGYKVTASGSGAIGIGSGTDGGSNVIASGSDAIALGTSTLADSEKAIAIGANSKGTAIGATALGRSSAATGASATALGSLASATGTTATAVGMQASASGNESLAIGTTASATSGRALAVGTNAKATGENSVAVGSGAGNSGPRGFASSINSSRSVVNTLKTINYATTAEGDNAVALGFYANAKNSGVAVGQNALAATGGVAIGKGVFEDTNNNLAGGVVIGQDSASTGIYSLAMGRNAFATGSTSMAMGYEASANGNFAVAMGRNVTATGTSTAIGHHATASNGGLAIGSQENDASNDKTTASAKGAVAIGKNTTASSEDTVAIGTNAQSDKKGAVALGSGSTTATSATNIPSATINGITYNFAGATNNPNMQVSVGNASATRQIKNVAAGEVSATSTDAINGSQLYAVASAIKPIKYVSINSTATGAGSNVDNDGAQGGNSIAIGPSSTVTKQNGIAIGSGAQSLSEDSVVIGRNAKAETKTGAGLTTTSRAIVIGSNSRVAADITQGVAIGSGLSPDEGAVVTGDQSIAIGGNVKVDGHSAIAIGGDDARKAANQLVSYTNKNDAEVTGTLQTAIQDLTGYNLTDYKGTTAAHAGVAYGTSALAGNAGVAIGTAANSMARMNDKGQVVNNNPVTNAVAIGTAARANFDNSVAIGGGSNTDHYATKQVNAIIDGVEVKWSGGENISPGDVVSFGAKGFERQLKNVAPGEVSQTSTDAVNGSQIYSLARKVTNIMNGGSGSVVNVNATGEPLSKVSTIENGTKVEKYYRTVDVKDDGTLVTGAVAQTPASLALVNVAQTDTNKQTQTPRILGNVANGVKDNDAVNVSQLNAAKVKYFSVNSSDAGNINNDGATGTDAIAIGPSAVSNAVGSVALGKDAKANGDFTVALGGGNWQFKGAQANGVGTTALGSSTKTKVGTNYQTAIGFGASTEAESALAIGYNAAASAQNAIALGRSASTAGQDAVALGSSSQAKGDSGLAIGNGAQANSNSVISLGYQANNGASNNANGVAIGWAAGMQSNGLNNVGVGTNAGRQVIGNNNTSLGNGAGNIANTKIYTSESIMLGTGAKVVGSSATKSIDNVIAIGKNTNGSASSAIAVGINAGSSAENGVAIGPNSNTSAYNGIALGSFSEASTAAGVQGYNVNTNRTDKYAGLTDIALTSKLGAVSVGNSTMTRQITGVAAGTNDTDAVNIAQLKSVNLAFTGNTGSGDVNLANSKLSINGDNTYIKTAANGKELTISPNVQNITLNNGRASASTGLADASNVAQAINNVVSGVQLDIIANKGTKTGSVNLSNQKLTVTGGNGIRTDIYSNTSGQNLVIGLEPELVKATTKGIGLTGDTGSTGLKYLKDGDAVFKVYGDGNLVTTAGSATGVKVSVDSTKVKDLAVEAVTVSKANTVDNPITVTSTTGTNSKDYAIGIDTTKLAAKTNLAYTANGAAAKTVSLAKGLNFVNGTNTVSSVDSDGKVSFDLNQATKDSINKSATAVGRTITLNADSGTGSSQSLSNGNVSFAVSGATGDYISTTMDGSAVKVSTKRATIDSDANTGAAFVTGADGLATAKNVASAINSAVNGLSQNLNISDGTNNSSVALKNQKLTVTGTGAAKATVSGQTITIDVAEGTLTPNTTNGTVTGTTGVAKATEVAAAINNTNTVLGNKITKNTQDIATNTSNITANKNQITTNTTNIATNTANIAHTIALADDKGTSTTAKSLKDGNVSFNIKGDNKFISTAASGNDVTLTVNEQAIKDAAKDASSFKVKANAHAEEAVKGGDTIAFNNGDNIEISQTGKAFTIGTAKNITVDSVTAGNTVINTSGLTNGTTAITGTGITTDKVTVGGISIDKTAGINAGGKVISNVASGTVNNNATDDSNAANIGDVKQAVANLSQNLNITDGTNNGTVDLKNQKLNVAGANGVTATVNNQTITVGLDADTVNATTKGIGLTADTGSTGNKYLKDGDVSFAVTGDGNLVSTSATAAGVKVAVDTAKVKDLAVSAVTVSKDTQADNPITVTPTAGTNSKDYAIGIDTTKLAAKTDLTYRANSAADANAKKVSLSKGLDFVDGGSTVATVDNDGKVSFDLNTATKTQINTNTADIATNKGNIVTNTADIATNKGNITKNTAAIATNAAAIARNITLGADTGTASSQSLSKADVAFNVKGATGDFVSTNMNGNTVEISTTRATINSNATTGEASVTGADGLATAKNVSDAINKAAEAAKAGAAWSITTNSSTTDKTAVKGGDTVDLVNGDNIEITQDGTDKKKITVATKKDITVDSVTANNKVTVGSGANAITLNGADGSVTGKAFTGTTFTGTSFIAGNTVINTNGLTNGTTAITGTGVTTDTLTVGGISIDKTDGINAGGKVISNVASGGTTVTNAANIGDIQTAVGNQNLKFAGNTNTAAGVVNIKDDTFNIIGDGKYVSTDANGKNLTVKVSEAEVKKSAVAAVTVSTDTTDANNPLTVTPTTSADGTTKDYKVTIDGTKIANKTNLSYKANDGTAKQVSLADGLNFKNGTLTTASIDDAGIVKYDVNTAAITAGTDGTVTGPTTDGVATAQNVADAINAAKKASKTEITANTGEAANATTGNVTLTSTTAADGHTIYDVKLNDKVTLGTGANAVTIDGTAGKATIGSSVVDGVNNTITTGGTNSIKVDGATGTVTGLTNKDWTPGVTKAVTGRAATEDQLQKVADAASSQTWNITADKAGTTGAQTGTKKNATVGKDETVELVAGDNLTINQDERKFTYSLNKALAGLTSVSVGDGTTETIKLDGATGKVTAKNAVIGGVTVDGDNSHVTGLSNTTWNGTATTGRAATEDQLKAVADTAKATTDAVNLKFSGDTNTSAGVVNLKDDTFNIVGDGKYVTTDANGKDLTVKVSEAEVKKSAVAAVTVSTDTTDANNPISVTPTTSADGTTKDYKVTIDGTKIANKTNLSYKANDGTAKQVSLADGLNFKNGTLTTASIDDAGVVKYDINTAAITAGADGTVTGPTTDGVATAQNVADAINVAKKASKTEITANTGEAANATTGNVTLTSTTAADGHTIYDVKLNDKVTLGTGNNAVTIDGTAGKATIGSSVVDGVNNTITTGGANAVALDGAAGTVKTGTVTVTGGTTNDITGLSNTTVNSVDFATKGRAATEEQLKAVGEQTWQITADKEATTSGNQTGTKKDAKVGKDDKVQLIAGENLTVNQNERDFTYSLNKDLVKMNSATFEATGGKTTVITGDSIAQTDGTKTNRSTAAGNTVADGGKSTATTADGTTVTNGADSTATTAAGTTVTNANGNTNYAADGVRINTTGKNPVSLTDAGLDNGNNVIKNVASGHVNNDDTDNTNAANIADVKKATTTVTANNGEAANATTGNVTLTSTTAADGHTIYDVKLNDKVTLGTGTNAVTIDGTTGKATIGSSVVDGVNNTITTGGVNAVALDGAAGTVKTGTVTVTGGTTNDITGLSNTTVNSADFATKGRAATEEQLKQVGEQTWQITADKDATTSGNQTGTKKDAKVGKDDKVQLIAGENLTVNQNERDFTYSLNKDLVKMNSATFEATGGKTTVITGDSIVQTAGTQTNTSTAVGNTVADGTKSTETTAAGQVIKDGAKTNTSTVDENTLVDGAKSNKITVDSNVINDGNGNANTSNATSNTITDGTNTSTVTAGKAQIGTVGIDGVASKLTTGGANAVVINGADGTVKTGTVTLTGGTTNDITGLSNTAVNSADFATKGRAATEEQLKQVGEQTWQITADKDAATSGNQTGTKKDAKVGKDDKVQLIAGENLTVNQNERDFTFSLNKDLVKLNSATFEVTGGKTTVITGDSITQTDGTKTNTSTAASNTVADGGKSTATTADGTTVTNANGNTKYAADGVRINTTGKNPVSLTDAGLDNGNNVIKNVASGHVNNDDTDNTNAANIADVKKATTTVTANNGEAANATTGNVTLTSTTATDGHTIYDVKLNDKVTLGTGANAVTIDGTAGKATIGSSVVDGVNNTITTGGANAVVLDGAAGTVKTGTVTVTGGTTNDITGLSNTTVTSADFATKGRAATEEQLKAVGEQTWQITADKDATTSGNQIGTKKDAKVGKDDKVQLIAGENLTVNQNERDFTYSLNKDLVKMNSATFEATGGKTTVITGNSISQTDGTKTNTSTAAGNTVADGTKSTETTAAGQVIKDGAKSNKSTVDSNVIDDGNGNVNTSNATSNTITDGTNTSAITAGKAIIGSSVVDGVNNTITTGGANAVALDGVAGTVKTGTVTVTGGTTNDITGLSNTTVNSADFATKGRAATEEQLKAVGEQTWQITADKDATTSGNQTGTKKDAKVGKDDKVQLIAGENLTVNQNERDFTYSLNKDLVKMNSATFEATGGKTTVIKGDSIVQTDGTKTNISTAAGNTVADGTKSTETTAAGYVIKDGAKSNKSTVDSNVIDDGNGNVNTSNATSNTIANGTDSTATTAAGTTVTNANGNTKYAADGVRINTTGKNPVSLTDAGLDNGNNVIKNVASGHVNNDDTDNTNAANIADVKKATTTVTANNGEAANATTGNVTLTSTTATDGHIIYDVKLNDKVTLGTGANAVTIDGTAGKATIGSSVVDGVNNTITTGGANAVVLDGAAGSVKTGTVTVTGGTTNDITGLSNTTVTSADFATKGRAATEEQLKAVGEQTWQITADKDATTSGNQTGTKKDAKVGKDDKVQLIAGENLTVNQNERDFTYSLNKDLVKMNSATFEATGGKTTVITGDSIAQTDGTKTNTSTAAGNTVADGGKSTATTADGTTVTNANGNTNYTADGVRINTTGKNPVSLTDAGLDNGNNVIKNVASGHVNNDDTDNTNAANIADVKKATTTVTANNGEAANATTGNVTLTSTTAADGHTIYDVKLNDTVTLGTGNNAVTIDGTAGKATIGSSVVDGVNNTITTGGSNAVKLDGAAGTVKTGTVTVTGGTTNDITGLSNTTVTSADFATKGRAATEEQLKQVGEQTWQITADKDATTSGNQTGTKKDAKVGKDDKVQLIAGENLTVNQNERDFTYSLNKDLVKMNSATFEATGGKTTVITGSSIAQTDGTKTNTSTAAGNTVADGTKSTETTAAGQVIKDGAKTNTSTVDENTLVDGAKSNKTTVDSNVIDDGNGNVNTSNATSNTITDGTNTTEATASTVTVKDNAGNSTVITKDTLTTGTGANKVTVDGTAGKVTAGSAVVDGVNNTITTGGANTVKLDGAAGTVTGLTNTAWTPGVTKAMSGRAATEDQLQQVSDAVGAGWNINSGTVAGSTGEANGSAKTKISSGEEVQLQAGNNLIIDQNGKTLSYSLNKNLKDMESAIFNATGGKTTVIKGDSIVQTDGGKTNTSNAAGNTVVDGTKSTATTAAGTTITDGAKTNTSTADKNVINDGAGNTNTSNATSNTIADPNGNTNTATATNNTLADNAGNSNVSNATSNSLTDNAGNSNVSNATSNTLKNAAGDETKVDAKGATVKDAAGNTTNVAATGATVTNAAGDTTKVEATGTTVADAAGNKATFTKDGVTITKPGKDTVSLTGNGLDNGNNKIVNVADGTNDTDAVNVRQLDAKTKAATTELTANGGESADNTTGNIVLTKTTAPDGHIIYDNKLNDKITLGAADPTKAITVDGTNGTIKAGKDGNAVAINGTDGTIKAGDGTNAVAIDGVNGSVKVADKIALNGKDGKAAIGTVGIDGKDGIITTGGNNPVAVNGKDGVVTGLTNKTWDPNNITSGRAATEDQVQSAVANAGWDATVGTEGSGVNSTPSAIPEKIRPNETLTFKAGNNMMVSHAGKTISYAVNPDLTDMKSATFKDAAGNTTVINGNGITITPGSANPNNPNAGPVSLTKDGLNNGNNQIKGVAPGSDDTDAVNIGQLKASNAKMGDAIGQVAGEVQRVGAHAAAMAALKPIQYDPLEPTQIMAGVGNYRGETAAALGLAHYTNEDTMFNVGVSVGGNHNMVNAGVTHKFGSSPEKKNIPDRYKAGPISSVYVMQDEVSSLKKENAEQKYVIADQAARLNTLEAENERQRQELAETKQGLDDLRAAVDKLLAAKG